MLTRRASIVQSLQALGGKYRRAVFRLGVFQALFVVAAWALVSFLADSQLELPGILRLAAVLAMLLFILKAVRGTRRRMASPPETADLAATVEAYAPSLEGQLFNLIELPEEMRDLGTAGESDLERQLLEKALTEAESAAARTHQVLEKALDLSVVRMWGALAVVTCTLGIFCASSSPDAFGIWFRRNALFSDEAWPRKTHFAFDRSEAIWHQPRKDPLPVSGWVTGAVPREVHLIARSEKTTTRTRLLPGAPGKVVLPPGDSVHPRLPAERAPPGEDASGREVEGRRLTHAFPAVLDSMELHFEGGDNESRRVRVVVHDRPAIAATRFSLRYPAYLGLEGKRLENPGGDVQVPAGTEITLEVESDQEISSGWVQFAGKEKTPAGKVEGKTFLHDLEPKESGFLDVAVVGKGWNLESRPPLRFAIVVIPDRPPSVSLELEGENRRMTPAAVVRYKVGAEDDHGFTDLSLRVRARHSLDDSPDEKLPESKYSLKWEEERSEKIVRAAADGALDLAPLGLDPGAVLTLQAAVADNDALAGPKTAFSQKETIQIVDPEALRDELEKIRIEAQSKLEELARKEEEITEGLKEIAQALNEPSSGGGDSVSGPSSSSGKPSGRSSRGQVKGRAAGPEPEESPLEALPDGRPRPEGGEKAGSPEAKGSKAGSSSTRGAPPAEAPGEESRKVEGAETSTSEEGASPEAGEEAARQGARGGSRSKASSKGSPGSSPTDAASGKEGTESASDGTSPESSAEDSGGKQEPSAGEASSSKAGGKGKQAGSKATSSGSKTKSSGSSGKEAGSALKDAGSSAQEADSSEKEAGAGGAPEEKPGAKEEGQPPRTEESPGKPSSSAKAARRAAENLSREQAAVGGDLEGVSRRIRDMVSALRQNKLLDPAEERRYQDEVSRPLDDAAKEEAPRSSSEIAGISKSSQPGEAAREAEERTARLEQTLKKIAERLAGSGDFREILQRMEMIIGLQKQVIGDTEKVFETQSRGKAPKENSP